MSASQLRLPLWSGRRRARGRPRRGGEPRAGDGLAFDAFIVTDRWLIAGATSVIVIVVWLLAGLAVGMLGDRYRGQVGASLDQAAEAREAVERVLDLTPSFHTTGSFTGVASAICRAALEATGCAALLW